MHASAPRVFFKIHLFVFRKRGARLPGSLRVLPTHPTRSRTSAAPSCCSPRQAPTALRSMPVLTACGCRLSGRTEPSKAGFYEFIVPTAQAKALRGGRDALISMGLVWAFVAMVFDRPPQQQRCFALAQWAATLQLTHRSDMMKRWGEDGALDRMVQEALAAQHVLWCAIVGAACLPCYPNLPATWACLLQVEILVSPAVPCAGSPPQRAPP